MKCRHFTCQCARVEQLMAMVDFSEHPDRLIDEALAIHKENKEVQCSEVAYRRLFRNSEYPAETPSYSTVGAEKT